MIFDVSRLIVPFLVVALIIIGEASIVFLIWIDRKVEQWKRGKKR